MSREKLKELGLDLPLLPTTTVGSFPKPEALREARTQFTRGAISRERLEDEERRATEAWITFQQEVGLDLLVDGEMYRGDMVAFFAETLKGFGRGGLVRSYGNRYYHKPAIVGEVKWEGPITTQWWKFAQGLSSRPVKGMLTGPYTIMDWSFNEYYPDRKAACFALAKEIRKEVEALGEAGAKVVQVDEPALSVRPEELPFALEAMRMVTEGLPLYFVSHICYGAFELVYPGILDLAVDNLDLEMSNSELDLLKLFEKHPFRKDLSFGVLDVHSHRIESAKKVEARLRAALRLLSPEALWVDPDCGLKTRSEEEARGKIQVMMEVVKKIRGELAR